MNNDRIEGVVKQATGTIKTVTGGVIGDAKLESERKAQVAEGKIRNAVGGLKDELKK